MAGGPFAEIVACVECLEEGRVTKATRVYEGAEDDHYRCEKGHEFGIDWRGEPATEAQWPPAPELVKAFANKN
jgi:hypothetical protein